MADTKVLEVERRNGQVRRVRIAVGPFEVDFVKIEGKVQKSRIERYDGSSNLYMPSYMFEPAIKVARGIFS